MTATTREQALLLLSAPWQWRGNESSLWERRLYGGLAALLLLAPAVAAVVWMPARPAGAVVGALAFLAVALYWGLQVGVLLRLDHPHVAHTVPGHSRALRVVTVGLWLGLAALCGVAAALGTWLLDGSGLTVGLAVVVGAATTLFLLAMAVRWWWLWVPLSLGPALMGETHWRTGVISTWLWLQQHWQAQPLKVTLAVVLVQGLLLPVVFGRGDGQHARAYASRERLRKVAADGGTGNKPALAAYGRWGEWLGQPWQRLSDAWLAHVCQRAEPSPRSAMARAEVVLHGSQHWVRHLSTGLLVQVVVALCLLATLQLTGVNLDLLLQGGHVGISIGLTSMALSAVMTLPSALWHSRREQALLVLLPGMPQGAALSRALAWRQFRQCLWTWAVMLPALLTMVWAGHALSLLTFTAVALPMSAWLWRDVSRLREARPAAALVPVVLCVVAGLLSAFLMSRHPAAWPFLLLGLLSLTAGLLAWRWRCMGRLPQALPAGRLA
jgi:hypothetical protein